MKIIVGGLLFAAFVFGSFWAFFIWAQGAVK